MNKKYIGAIVAGIIIIGIIVTCILGLNFDLKYREHKEIEILINQEFNNDDIKNIAKEVFGNQKVTVTKVELYEDMVSVAVENASDEEIENLNTKINEKYGLNNTLDDISITDIPKERGIDIVKPYIAPTIVSFVIIEACLFVYLYFYKKYGKEEKDISIPKSMLELAIYTLAVGLLFISFYAITRIPVNRLTMPIAMIVFILPSIYEFIKK